MDLNWIWLAGLIVAIVFFAVVEGYALKHPTRLNTLSHCIAYIGSYWPLSIWFCGIFAGGLAVHFFWHYCPSFGINYVGFTKEERMAVTVQQVTDTINAVVVYAPMVWTFISTVIAAASILASRLPVAKPGTFWYGVKTVLNVLAQNVHNSRVVNQNPAVLK